MSTEPQANNCLSIIYIDYTIDRTPRELWSVKSLEYKLEERYFHTTEAIRGA